MTITTINGVPARGSVWTFSLAGELAIDGKDGVGARGLPENLSPWPPEADRSESRATAVAWRIEVSKMPVEVQAD